MNKGIGLEIDALKEPVTVTKSDWQIAIEQRLDSLSAANDALSAQVVQLQDEVRRIRG